jgi:hypothetical protein
LIAAYLRRCEPKALLRQFVARGLRQEKAGNKPDEVDGKADASRH